VGGAGGMTWLWWGPLVAAALHIVEEFLWPGGFAEWDRAYRPEIKESITPRLHLVVNAALLALCFTLGIAGQPGGVLAIGGTRLRSVFPPTLAVPAWIGIASLLASNAVFHVVGTIRTRKISPGVRTGVLLYIPLALFGAWHFLRTGQVSAAVAAIAILAGGSYHLWAALLHRARVRPAGAA
jgi:hypothetical protein